MDNITFLFKALNKQFELAGCPITAEELSEMNIDEQAVVWENYKLTQTKFNKWKKFFISEAIKDNAFEELNNTENKEELLEIIFNSICEEWGLPVKETKRKTKKVED